MVDILGADPDLGLPLEREEPVVPVPGVIQETGETHVVIQGHVIDILRDHVQAVVIELETGEVTEGLTHDHAHDPGKEEDISLAHLPEIDIAEAFALLYSVCWSW